MANSKVIITCAVTGAIHTPSMSPYLPVTADELEQAARAMADGARNKANVDLAVSITGIAGPDGGSDKKPVGLVYLACATHEGTKVVEKRFGDLGRDGIREASVLAALALITDVATKGVQEARPAPADPKRAKLVAK